MVFLAKFGYLAKENFSTILAATVDGNFRSV